METKSLCLRWAAGARRKQDSSSKQSSEDNRGCFSSPLTSRPLRWRQALACSCNLTQPCASTLTRVITTMAWPRSREMSMKVTRSRSFLRALRQVLRAGDALLLGADLRKDAQVLEAAYDDSLGVTASFNLNQLARINRELDADFSLRAFRHYVTYNERVGRVEVYLESLREQWVSINKLEMKIHFREGERIHTENSCKYDLEGLSRLAQATGYKRARTWLDERESFSSNLFIAIESSQ